jgi:hypothetical protein
MDFKFARDSKALWQTEAQHWIVYAITGCLRCFPLFCVNVTRVQCLFPFLVCKFHSSHAKHLFPDNVKENGQKANITTA